MLLIVGFVVNISAIVSFFDLFMIDFIQIMNIARSGIFFSLRNIMPFRSTDYRDVDQRIGNVYILKGITIIFCILYQFLLAFMLFAFIFAFIKTIDLLWEF